MKFIWQWGAVIQWNNNNKVDLMHLIINNNNKEQMNFIRRLTEYTFIQKKPKYIYIYLSIYIYALQYNLARQKFHNLKNFNLKPNTSSFFYIYQPKQTTNLSKCALYFFKSKTNHKYDQYYYYYYTYHIHTDKTYLYIWYIHIIYLNTYIILHKYSSKTKQKQAIAIKHIYLI